MRKEDNPSLPLLPSPGHAAAEPGARLDAGQPTAPGGGLDARYEQLRHAALHTRGEAFPLGLGVLACKGVIAWQRALASLAPAARATPAGLPGLLAFGELGGGAAGLVTGVLGIGQFPRGLKRHRSARILAAGHAFVQNLRRGHYELATDVPARHRIRAAFDQLAMAV
jgi:hypothetical protein